MMLVLLVSSVTYDYSKTIDVKLIATGRIRIQGLFELP